MTQQHNQFAFPCLERGGQGLELTDAGMLLRDYFAAKAMPCVMAEIYSWGQQLDGISVPEITAKFAYQFADAMMEARDK